MIQGPARSKEHCAARLSWAHRNISQGDSYWWKTLFSYANKFDLNNLDRNRVYWCALRNGKHRIFARVGGETSVMVLGLFLFTGQATWYFKKEKNSSTYCQKLEAGLLPFIADISAEASS